jgi:hypothetical protein
MAHAPANFLDHTHALVAEHEAGHDLLIAVIGMKI